MSSLTDNILNDLENLIKMVREERDVEDLPDVLLDRMIELFKPDIACYYVKETHTKVYKKRASYPDSFWQRDEIKNKFDIRDGEGYAIGRAIKEKRLIYIDNPIKAEKRGEYIPFSHEIGEEVVLPILAREGFIPRESVVAIIILSKHSPKRFLPEERRLIEIVGLIGSAIYNSAFSSRRRDNRISFLKTATELQGDMDEVCRKFLKALSKIIPSKFIFLWSYNALDETCVIRSFYPPKINGKEITFKSLDNRVLEANSLSGAVISTRRPQVFTNIQTSSQYSNREFAKRFGLEYFVSIPVLDIDNKPLGVVSFYPFDAPEAFDEEALKTMVTHVAPIANIMLMSSLHFMESLLYKYDDFFDKMLNFQEGKVSWDELAHLIKAQMKCEACSIFLVKNDNRLYLKGTTGIEGNPRYEDVWYEPGDGSTGIAFKEETAFIFYKERPTSTLLSKFSETLPHPKERKSVIFMPIFDKNKKPIGVIRCINKQESPSLHVGRFTKEDSLQLEKITKVVSNIYSKVLWLREREIERERSLNGLHHEILSPVDGFTIHIEWLERHLKRYKRWLEENPTQLSPPLDLNKVQIKFNDMKQSAKLLDVLVTTMGRFDDINLNIREFSLPELLKTCAAYLVNDLRSINIHYLGVNRIKGDPLQLMRVFYNLLKNAIKYSDPNEKNKLIQVYDKEEPNYFVLVFYDNGIGIKEGEEKIIFEKFERGSNAPSYFPEGTGLGLAYCKSIIEKHGGTIRISHRAKPTIFEVRIPKRIQE